jgi:hypothetical protein
MKYLLGLGAVLVVVVLYVIVALTRSEPDLVGKLNPVREPMVLALNYWEQTANALKNLLDLQCWAHTVNIIKVVEPSIVPFQSSTFNFRLDNDLQLRNLFDIAHWNNMSYERGYSSLVSLENFLANSIRDLVFVFIKYADWTAVPSCDAGIVTSLDDWYPLLNHMGFRVVKCVCIDFARRQRSITEKELGRLIFNNTHHGGVSLIFNQWRGIRVSERVALKDSRCSNCLRTMAYTEVSGEKSHAINYTPLNSVSPIQPSQEIQRVLNHFLKQHLSGARYMAVMIRSEKISSFHFSSDSSCASRIISDVTTMRVERSITKTFFFSDLGSYGSANWDSQEALSFSDRIQGALNVSLTTPQLNAMLQSTVSLNSVQVALLHQQLVAHATCVVMVGGGAFQMQTLHMYALRHRGQECYVFRHKNCERNYISRVYGQRVNKQLRVQHDGNGGK